MLFSVKLMKSGLVIVTVLTVIGSLLISLSVSAAPDTAQSSTSSQKDETSNEGLSYEEKVNIFYGLNDIQHYNNCSTVNGSSTTVQLGGGNNVEKALNYLIQHGFSLEQAAGIVGNMQWESGSESLNAQGSDGKAFGIAQWQDARLSALKQYGGSDYASFDTQLRYLGVELGLEAPQNGVRGGSESKTIGAMKDTNTPEEAALAWERAFERSADTPGSIGYITRQSNARKLFEQYKNGGTTQSLASTSGSGSASSGNCATGSAGVNSNGYAFPVALPKSDVTNGTSWPCPGICHHDGTPAFDLSKNAKDDSSENIPVIAIYDGTIQRFNNTYGGTSGCQSFQLVGKDGWWYWYGHLQSATVQDGAEVKAGQQIAAIGRRACTGNGSYPHLHIDRGSPQGHYGGSVCCRDPGMTPLINQLYEELGGTPSAL